MTSTGTNVQKIAEKINKANRILLSTHRQCDGDGLGAQLGLFHALVKAGKDVRIVNVDRTPRKYEFLSPDQHIQYYEETIDPLEPTDLVLIFDTNDKRLVEPLYSALESIAKEIIFIDHHPILSSGPSPTPGSVIDIEAASTGEMTFEVIQQLHIDLDATIARALYASIAFDTQVFRFIRNSPKSHIVAAELLNYEKNPREVHRALFGNHTLGKLQFLAKALGSIRYLCEERLAVLRVDHSDLNQFELDADDARDIIDMIMNIDTVEAAVMFREDGPNQYKLSFRSKGQIEVLKVAEKLGGGGHRFSAGAFVTGSYAELEKNVIKDLQLQFPPLPQRKNG